MHYVKIQNKNALKSSFQSRRKLFIFFFLNLLFKNFKKKKQYNKIKTFNDYRNLGTCTNVLGQKTFLKNMSTTKDVTPSIHVEYQDVKGQGIMGRIHMNINIIIAR